MAANGRESRRRKILDRGSDRLALITGRVQTPPSDSISSSQPLDSDQFNGIAASPHVEDKPSLPTLPKHDSVSKSAIPSTLNGGPRTEPPLRKSETCVEPLLGQSSEIINQEHSSAAAPSTVKKPTSTSKPRFFNPNQISSAIKASESTRILSSLMIAALSVLSHVGFPILGSSLIKSFILSRPLILLILTNLTIVIARLLPEKQKGLGTDGMGVREVSSEDEYGWAGKVGKALEVGLILQKVFGSMFVDCSLYAVVLICGLSLASEFSS